MTQIDWRHAGQAGLVYTLCVFVFAFAAGTIRVTLVAPRVGALMAVILEAPLVLAASWVISRWCTAKFKVRREVGARVRMGVVAFAVLMLLELGVSAWVFGEGLEHYLAKYATTPGLVGLAMQVCFAALPLAQCRTQRV
jgi:hypothetical protein